MSEETPPEEMTAEELNAAAALAGYISEQSTFVQQAHSWLKSLIVALGMIMLGLFVWAFYVSVWTDAADAPKIAAWWFAWLASNGLVLLAIGLHALVVRASPPAILPGYQGRLVTGHRATRQGRLLVVVSMLMLVVFGGLALYASQSGRSPLVPFVVAMVAVAIGAGLVAILVNTIKRSGRK